MAWANADTLGVLKIALVVILGLAGYSILTLLQRGFRQFIWWFLAR